MRDREILLNLSGHRLSFEAIKIFRSKYRFAMEQEDDLFEIAIPNLDFTLEIEEILEPILSKISSRYLTGDYKLNIIVPGHSTLTSILLIYLHGTLGHFPNIFLLDESEISGNYIPIKIFKGNEIREKGREKRLAVWDY